MRVFFLICFLFKTMAASSQPDTLRLDLQAVVAMAQGETPDVQIVKTSLETSYWQYQSFLAGYRPQINFSATLPNLNRAIDAITLPDGSDAFVNRSLMRNRAGLTLQQDVALTGGSLFAGTSLQRIDVFSAGGSGGSISYLSTPLTLGFVQPLFSFNALQWNRRIEPLRFEESQRVYSEDMEEIAYQAVQLFFDVLIAQLNLDAAGKNKADADTLYAISEGRFRVGRIAETELLQIELNVRNADIDLAESTLSLQTSTERLRNLLGIREQVFFSLIPPASMPEIPIDPEKALRYARLHRSETVGFERRILEAQRDVAEAKGRNGLNVDLFVSFGLSRTAGNLSEVYKDPLDQEQVSIGIDVPIADWGKARSDREIARSNEKLIQMRIAQERVNFERDVLVKVQQFDLVRRQVNAAWRAYEVALKRLDITRQRYRIGTILITDLNLAINEEASSRRAFFNALRNFWLAYYDLRRLTLYDFENDRPLIRE